jgi:hypothetical protein
MDLVHKIIVGMIWINYDDVEIQQKLGLNIHQLVTNDDESSTLCLRF